MPVSDDHLLEAQDRRGREEEERRRQQRQDLLGKQLIDAYQEDDIIEATRLLNLRATIAPSLIQDCLMKMDQNWLCIFFTYIKDDPKGLFFKLAAGNILTLDLFLKIPKKYTYHTNIVMREVYAAIKRDDVQWLSIIFPHIVNVINQYHKGCPPVIFEAILDGKIETVKFLISKGVKLDILLDASKCNDQQFKEYDGYAPLHLAARKGNLHIIATVGVKMRHDKVPLDLAMRGAWWGFFKGETALTIALKYNQMSAADLIAHHITTTSEKPKADSSHTQIDQSSAAIESDSSQYYLDPM